MEVSTGSACPLGPSIVYTPTSNPTSITVNFAVFAHVPKITLLLFPPLTPPHVIRDAHTALPFTARTGAVWHLCLHNLHPDTAYAFHIPSSPLVVVSDPYAKWLETPGKTQWMQVEGETFDGKESTQNDAAQNVLAFLRSFPTLRGLSVAHVFRPCRITPPKKARQFDWGDERTPLVNVEDLIIYEAHVRALTSQGTYAAAVNVVPYLKWLGVTALQLMPVFEFSEVERGSFNGDFNLLGYPMGNRKGNMWGYSPMSWFSPMNRYAEEAAGGPYELKVLVKALHEAGIECFLDVVYNHTANTCCPLHFLKVQGEFYMGKKSEDGFKHMNVSGCGNTLSPNSPLMMELLMASLRWFVTEYRVDGFRIDAAGILCRDEHGKPVRDPVVIRQICEDPVLKNTKFIVEGWDAGDSIGSPNMLLGSKHGFPRGEKFCEWNAEFRDAIRRFEKGDKDSTRAFCKALRGSAHLFGDGKNMKSSRPLGAGHSVNFVACHDGFSMADVVSFRERVNQDGYDEISFNCGAEGRTLDAAVNSKRARHVRNFIFYLTISRGIPMICQGDELGFSKKGNSNTWNNPELYMSTLPACPQNCNDLEDIIHFTKRMFDLRRSLKQLRGVDFFKDLVWLDDSGNQRARSKLSVSKNSKSDKRTLKGASKSPKMTSSSTEGRLVAFRTHPDDEGICLYVAMNNTKVDVGASLPKNNQGMIWMKVIDTSTYVSDWGEQSLEGKRQLLPLPLNVEEITICRQSCVLYTEHRDKTEETDS